MNAPALPVDPWLEGIEGEYLPRLILSDANVIRVVAGPGSGKTTGLKRRIQRLLERDSVEPSRIYVGTFTRAIAQELTDELGDHVVRGVRVSTLHSLAYELLRSHPPAQIGHNLRFLLEFEEASMLYDIGLETRDGLTMPERRTKLRRLQAAWSERRALGDAAFEGAVDRWLRSHEALLIGEVVPLALRGLESGDIPSAQYDHVVVDEYQDLTAAEQRMVELIWSGDGSLVVAGDDDQSIYSFRFNHPGGITEFSERWAVEDIPLPENRRSGHDIVALANTLMAEGGSSKPAMIPTRDTPGSVTLLHWATADSEVDGLADYLRGQSDDYLVLVPRRFIGHRLVDVIGDDASTSFYQEVLEHQVVQERFALASILADASDRVATRAWLGFVGNRPEQAAERNAVAYASARGSGLAADSLLRAVATNKADVSGKGRDNLRARAKSYCEAHDSQPTEPGGVLDFVFDPACAMTIADEEKRKWAAADLGLLRDAGRALLEEMPGRSLNDIVTRLRYRIATRAPLGEPSRTRIRIMTLHSAKGLQADRTVLAGMADEIVPGPPDDDVSAEERRQGEQRRLVYVAATRARQELLISWPRSVLYADAMQNAILVRPRSVTTVRGQRMVGLGRSRFIPAGFGTPMRGEQWHADWLGARSSEPDDEVEEPVE